MSALTKINQRVFDHKRPATNVSPHPPRHPLLSRISLMIAKTISAPIVALMIAATLP
jgi:hypothetical protein